MRQVFKLYDLSGRCKGKRAIGVTNDEAANRLRRCFIQYEPEGVCFDCGHTAHRYVYGEPKHEKDHFSGYTCINKILVQEVCRPCHVKRTVSRIRAEKKGLPKYPT